MRKLLLGSLAAVAGLLLVVGDAEARCRGGRCGGGLFRGRQSGRSCGSGSCGVSYGNGYGYSGQSHGTVSYSTFAPAVTTDEDDDTDSTSTSRRSTSRTSRSESVRSAPQSPRRVYTQQPNGVWRQVGWLQADGTLTTRQKHKAAMPEPAEADPDE